MNLEKSPKYQEISEEEEGHEKKAIKRRGKKAVNENSIEKKQYKPSTYPFGNCKVCGDKATGIHYGVSTCEGCKGFFKRSILKKEIYKCVSGEKCVLNRNNRNKCKSCRFKTCIAAGMSFKGIKMGRIPKAEKEKALQLIKNGQTTNNNDQKDESESENHLEDLEFDGSEFNESLCSIESFPFKRKHFDLNHDENSSENSTDKTEESSMNMMNFPIRLRNSCSWNDAKKRQETLNLSRKFYNRYNKFVHTDENKRLKKLYALVAKSDDEERHSLENMKNNEDNLRKFFNLIQGNKINLDHHLETLSIGSGCSVTNQSNQGWNGKNRTSEILVKNILGTHTHALKALDLLPNTFFSDLFTKAFTPSEPAYQVIFSLLNDKVYQIFNEHTMSTYKKFERIKREMEHPERMRELIEKNNHRSMREVFKTLLKTLPDALQHAIAFGKDLPGLNELNSADFAVIINKKMFDFFMIVNSVLFIGGESYMYIGDEDIIYTRYWMNTLRPKQIVDPVFTFMKLFNSLFLTYKEKALLIALLFTVPSDVEVKDSDTLKDLNEYYTRAILYEFDLNNRSVDFLMKLKQALELLAYNRRTHSFE